MLCCASEWVLFSLEVWYQLSWVENTPLFIEALDFSYGLSHQGPNGAVITYFSPVQTYSSVLSGHFGHGRRFLVTAFYTRGQMALSAHTSPLISTGPGLWTRAAIFRVQLRKLVNQAAVFNSSGENIDPAPCKQDLHRGCSERTDEAVDRGQYRFKAFSKSWTPLSTTKASSDWVSANAAKISGGLNCA